MSLARWMLLGVALAGTSCASRRQPEPEVGASLAMSPPSSSHPPALLPIETRQLLLVLTKGWDEVAGTLHRLERTRDGWSVRGALVPVVVGRSGLAWGRGVWAATGTAPRKHEGDGRAPAGVFALGPAFGYAPTERLVKLPYLALTPETVCVDDPASRHYNRIFASKGSERDWSSAETMRRADDLYRMGVVVRHNEASVLGEGSCIFLHIWRGSAVGTAGCTAMAEGDLVDVTRWLDPGLRPLLVQLPVEEYERLRAPWGLPGRPRLPRD